MGNAMKITAIKPQKKAGNRFNVFVDGEFKLALGSDAFQEFGIHLGKEVSDSEIENLKTIDQISQALERAKRFLATRPRSESEVRNRMKRYGYPETVTNAVIDRLIESGLIDDASFAVFWRNNRTQFNPRSIHMLTSELKQKGIDPDICTEVVSEIDDKSEALRAGYKKARSLPSDNYNEFRRKLGAFLYRRGFNYETVSSTVEHFWNEKVSEVRNGTE
jgi:regulatory protein